MAMSKRKKRFLIIGAIVAILLLLFLAIRRRRRRRAINRRQNTPEAPTVPVAPIPAPNVINTVIPKLPDSPPSSPSSPSEPNKPGTTITFGPTVTLPELPTVINQYKFAPVNPAPPTPVQPEKPDPMKPTEKPTMGQYYAVKKGDSPLRNIAQAGFPLARRRAARKVMENHVRNAWIQLMEFPDGTVTLTYAKRFEPMSGHEEKGWAWNTKRYGRSSAKRKFPCVYIPDDSEV